MVVEDLEVDFSSSLSRALARHVLLLAPLIRYVTESKVAIRSVRRKGVPGVLPIFGRFSTEGICLGLARTPCEEEESDVEHSGRPAIHQSPSSMIRQALLKRVAAPRIVK